MKSMTKTGAPNHLSFLLSSPVVQDQQSHHVTAEDRIKRAAAPEPNPRASSSSVLVHDPCPSIDLLLIYNYIHLAVPLAFAPHFPLLGPIVLISASIPSPATKRYD